MRKRDLHRHPLSGTFDEDAPELRQRFMSDGIIAQVDLAQGLLRHDEVFKRFTLCERDLVIAEDQFL